MIDNEYLNLCKAKTKFKELDTSFSNQNSVKKGVSAMVRLTVLPEAVTVTVRLSLPLMPVKVAFTERDECGLTVTCLVAQVTPLPLTLTGVVSVSLPLLVMVKVNEAQSFALAFRVLAPMAICTDDALTALLLTSVRLVVVLTEVAGLGSGFALGLGLAGGVAVTEVV